MTAIVVKKPSEFSDVTIAAFRAKFGLPQTSSAGVDNFNVHSENNVIAGSVYSCTIGGGGNATAKNLIGSTGKPYYSDFTPTDWADDLGYVANAASVATIGGGYDNIVNQIAGTIGGGGHNFIKYNSDGHSIIGGGSYNLISGFRSGIFSGRRNTVTNTTSGFSFIGGGDSNNIVGSYSVIPGGLLNIINGDYSFAFGRRAEANASGTFVIADGTSSAFAVATANVFGAMYAGGYWLMGGRVGIGTTAPTAKLHVKGSLAQTYYTPGDYGLVVGNRGDSGGDGIAVWANASTGDSFIGNLYDNATSGLNFVTRANSAANSVIVMSLKGGRVGIGTTAPTAILHLPAATAAANTASMKIDAGVLATVPVSGNIESDGTHIYWTNSGGTRIQLDN